MEERLQKILSAAGICSRRAAEDYLLQGRVTVNGTPAALGMRADLEIDRVEVDGVPISPPGRRIYLMLYKPRGYVTTLEDEKDRPTVAQLVSRCGTRVWPVGRLDLDSEGLLLLTNDGAFTHRLTHPSHQVEKEYHTWVKGPVEPALQTLSQPMALDGVPLAPAKVVCLKREIGQAQLSITIHEGKNRQVRRMCAQAGLAVTRLIRVREGSLALDPNLRPGQWRLLTQTEWESLCR